MIIIIGGGGGKKGEEVICNDTVVVLGLYCSVTGACIVATRTTSGYSKYRPTFPRRNAGNET